MRDAYEDGAQRDAPRCRNCAAPLLRAARHCTHCGQARRLGPAWDYEARARVVLSLALAVQPLERALLALDRGSTWLSGPCSLIPSAAFLLAGTALLGVRRADFVLRRRGDLVLGLVFGALSFLLGMVFLTLSLPLDIDWEALQPAPEPPGLELLMAVLIAPLVEELFFRGVLWRALRTLVSTWTTSVLTSFVFAACHGALYGRWIDFPDLFLAGLVFAYLRFETRGLWAPIVAHACGNALFFAISR